MARKSSMGRVRKSKRAGRQSGFIITWDVDSADRATAARVYRFVFGDRTQSHDKVYRYPGFVDKPEVRYLGQSVLFVAPQLLAEIDEFLISVGVDHEATRATLG